MLDVCGELGDVVSYSPEQIYRRIAVEATYARALKEMETELQEVRAHEELHIPHDINYNR